MIETISICASTVIVVAIICYTIFKLRNNYELTEFHEAVKEALRKAHELKIKICEAQYEIWLLRSKLEKLLEESKPEEKQ